MLFNSLEFITAFLPVTLIGFFLAAAWGGKRAAIFWLICASLFFYSWWDYRNLFILVPSVAANYCIGWAIGRARDDGHVAKARLFVGLGVAVNLAAIAYFKYLNCFVDTIGTATGLELAVQRVVLPLGISFFTFQQIKFLVDRYTGASPRQPDLAGYVLLVTFFPHVIAGPIVHHDDLLPQFEDGRVFRFSPALFADGVALFLLGLAKKVVLADQFGLYANDGFDAATAGQSLTFFAAWGAALAYTLQLYFDFSAYSDMAIGLARMFGLRFPLNFNSPYKAVNIIDFWRRWHMTLSRFLRDYLYVPMGGNRQGPRRRYANLMATMLLGGLWHGAGWPFVFWGGLHGLYLVINNGWHRLRHAVGYPPGTPSPWGRCAGCLLTLLAVIVGWVFFRAADFQAAIAILRGMAGLNGAVLPSQIVGFFPMLARIADGAGVVPHLAGGTIMGFIEMVILVSFGFTLALFAPNLHQISAKARLALLVPSFGFTLQKVLFAAGATQFLYFRF
jgi:D-alanyl-lipoteichoic acid acyltransferase DltB (MBOAT superfamily)